MPQFTDWQVLVGVMILIAFLTETIVEFVKNLVVGYYLKTNLLEIGIQIIATVLSILLAWLFDARLFVTDNIGLIIISYVIVGLVSSRGANYVHNWLDKLPRK